MEQKNRGQIAVERARSASDYLVLVVTFGVFFLISSGYFIVSFVMSEEAQNLSSAEFILGLIGTLIGGLMAFGALLLLGMFLVRMARQTMLGNSLQIEYSDYAWLRDWINTVSADLGLPRVEIFVTQNPVMNAYAFGFTRPYCIVLNSGSIRYLTDDELRVIVVHEMAHIKYGHTSALVYLQPFMSLPIISAFGSWIAGFWNRRAELTADRLALMYLLNPELVKSAIIKIHVGPDVAKSMNQIARDWLQYNAERPMNRVAQTFSTHPFLVRRLSHIDRYSRQIPPKAGTAQSGISPSG
ncbi:hypothetical protein EOM60_04520 [Candidatus Saccharibacteria bacterium]|nr:hypothetical protein [Candidatus Saccharibacteria bacterium]